MIIIGITGSIASGKSTVAQLIGKKKYPIFSADKFVQKLYKNLLFINLLIKKLNLKNKKNIKKQIKTLIKKDKKKLLILESVIHPRVRKEMKSFLKKKSRILVLEIPLLIESNLSKYFDTIIFVDAKKELRLKRYLKNINDQETFETLNKHQLTPIIKKKFCDLVIDNNYSLTKLKKSVKQFTDKYE